MGLHWLDWVVLGATMVFIVGYGVWKTRGAQTTDSYISGGKEAEWWTIGLSVMATQASAITFISTPGQAFHDGMGFLQIYFGLPLAIIFICIFFIPRYQKMQVYTAYEYLETRFGLPTRTLTSFLFLFQRGLGAGITIYAPAIILCTILGWDLTTLNFILGILVIIYTVSGGTKAVSVTQKQQMFVIMLGMVIAFVLILQLLPESMDFGKALTMAGVSEKFNILNFNFNPNETYTIWSGLLGGFFLSLSYFGTDQSQVQRYLSGKSVKESQWGLLFNGFLKIPMQFFILLAGVMVYIFFLFQPAPIFFNEATLQKLRATEKSGELVSMENSYKEVFNERLDWINSKQEMDLSPSERSELLQLHEKEKSLRKDVKSLIDDTLPDEETNDKDYVFIYFILKYLPIGLIGLLLAMIFSAAMSSTASELNALASTTTIDIYKRIINSEASDDQYLRMTKYFTVMWGLVAIAFACVGSLFENLIQFVNIVGSLFYGAILGVFLVAFFFKSIKGKAVFIATIQAEVIVISLFYFTPISFLWYNLIGCAAVIIFGYINEWIFGERLKQLD